MDAITDTFQTAAATDGKRFFLLDRCSNGLQTAAPFFTNGRGAKQMSRIDFGRPQSSFQTGAVLNRWLTDYRRPQSSLQTGAVLYPFLVFLFYLFPYFQVTFQLSLNHIQVSFT